MRQEDPRSPAIVCGSGAERLGAEIADLLRVTPLESRLDRFPDGELDVAVDPAVRERDAYVIQSLGPPVNDHLVELLLLVDACRRESASRVTAVLPYLGYARKDRRTGPGEPVGLRVVADMLAHPRIDRVAVMNPHVLQVEAIFAVPVTIMSAVSVLASALLPPPATDDVVVAPDAGAIGLAERYSAELGLDRVAVVLKDRQSGTEVSVSGIASDGSGGDALLVDDMITTGGTLEAAAAAVRDSWGPGSLRIAATHPVLVDDAIERAMKLEPAQVVVTDTILHDDLPEPFEVVGVADVVASHLRDLTSR